MKRAVVSALIAVLLVAAARAAAERAARAQNATSDPYALMYLPEGRILRAASLGHRSFLADLVWMRTIQYYGEQRLTTHNYDEAERLFQVIYDLDPRFKGATRFGALVLSQDAGNPKGAIALLRRAAADDPSAWEYPFDEGFICQTVLNEYGEAGAAYQRAADLPGAPELARRLAGASFARLGDRKSAREIWAAILAGAENDMTRRIAQRNLKNLAMADTEEALTDAVRRFRDQKGRLPENWEELLRARMIDALPHEPWGGAFFWDASTDKAYSSTYVDRNMVVTAELLRSNVALYHRRHGRYPETLDELVTEGLVKFPAWEPFGVSLEYDARSGRIAWNPPWPPAEPGLREQRPS
jgi:tetratricopeptide (TPR) repeat protein